MFQTKVVAKPKHTFMFSNFQADTLNSAAFNVNGTAERGIATKE